MYTYTVHNYVYVQLSEMENWETAKLSELSKLISSYCTTHLIPICMYVCGYILINDVINKK